MTIKVMAKETGFHGGLLRYPGDVFELETKTQMGRWMEIVDDTEGGKTSRRKSAPATNKDPDPEAGTASDHDLI